MRAVSHSMNDNNVLPQLGTIEGEGSGPIPPTDRPKVSNPVIAQKSDTDSKVAYNALDPLIRRQQLSEIDKMPLEVPPLIFRSHTSTGSLYDPRRYPYNSPSSQAQPEIRDGAIKDYNAPSRDIEMPPCCPKETTTTSSSHHGARLAKGNVPSFSPECRVDMLHRLGASRKSRTNANIHVSTAPMKKMVTPFRRAYVSKRCHPQNATLPSTLCDSTDLYRQNDNNETTKVDSTNHNSPAQPVMRCGARDASNIPSDDDYMPPCGPEDTRATSPSRHGTEFTKANVPPFPPWCRFGMRQRFGAGGNSREEPNFPIPTAPMKKLGTKIGGAHPSTRCNPYNGTILTTPRDSPKMYHQYGNIETYKGDSLSDIWKTEHKVGGRSREDHNSPSDKDNISPCGPGDTRESSPSRHGRRFTKGNV